MSADDVWVAIRRRGILYHRQQQPMKDYPTCWTACGRRYGRTRTGDVEYGDLVTVYEAVRQYQGRPCKRCYPDGVS